MKLTNYLFLLFAFQLHCLVAVAQSTVQNATQVNVGEGWAGNSVNTVVFRKNSLVTHKDVQFISYYDADGFVVLGKRKLNEQNWELKRTAYKGSIKDAHNSISIAVDGNGYLHMAWDHHNHPLRYVKSKEPLSLELTEKMPMTGKDENKLSYPEFYHLPNGDLLFFYRDGGSGNGNMVMNRYDVAIQQWSRVQTNLIDGEGKRNAYWQACVDAKGTIHVSWVWRESPDVASNHDMSYALSKDGGRSWQKSTGELYQLPIRMATAEVVCTIPQSSELINQTSMTTDADGNAVIASYWKGKNNVPQYKIISKTTKGWAVTDLGFRTSDFSLSGAGTKQIPIARPQVLCVGSGKKKEIVLVFRDAERGNKVSIACGTPQKSNWKIIDLTTDAVGAWEPSYDTELWKAKQQLHLFVQQVTQADGEGVVNTKPQMVQVLEWRLKK
ncbi:neuraminidase [Lacibacter luteus]|uniref:Neuraminidase n=1 Tax=Lacibacter luteus TaxID=2508719 RepID=A0A4Q1CMJ4_9BACT|nr:BNR repeat-containing protein [Lacibacter luteus]RXK62246.1 neuraminidase [Lacibacter luteus]